MVPRLGWLHVDELPTTLSTGSSKVGVSLVERPSPIRARFLHDQYNVNKAHRQFE